MFHLALRPGDFAVRNLRVAAFLLATLVMVACGDESDTKSDSPSNNGANNQAQNNDANNQAQNNGANNQDANNNQGANNAANNQTANNSPNNGDTCGGFSLSISDPQDGRQLTIADDTDPGETGIQITVRAQTRLPDQTIVTVVNQTTSVSWGGLATAGTAEIQGVVLQDGANQLRAFAATEECVVEDTVTVSYEAPVSCAEDQDCPAGQRCETDYCAPCASTCGTQNDCGEGECVHGCCQDLETPYVYVLIEDLTDPIGGRSPGADVDAVSVLQGNEEHFVTVVESSRVGGPDNEFTDVAELIGPPDSGCEVVNFVALGGAQFGGYAVVSFADGVTIKVGDRIKVYEVGQLMCGRYDGDPFRVSVSISTDLNSFVVLGDGGVNRLEIPVTDLP